MSDDARRVVITGMGAVSPLGLTATDLWQGLRNGQSAIGPLRHPDSDRLRVRVAAQVPAAFDDATGIDPDALTLMDRNTQMAVVAAREAVAQSALDFEQVDLRENAATVVGSGVGGELTQDTQSRALYAEGKSRVHPFTIPRLMINASASQISMNWRLHGPAFVVSSACASANHALIQAAQLIRSGQCQVVLSGGTEACLSYGSLRSWEAMRVLADDTCRPFDAKRRGLVLGEGAAIFVLESLAHARARGAPMLAEIAGGGMSADGTDVVQPAVKGQVRAIDRALQDAGLATDEVDLISAHGTGTKANDVTETRAIRTVFGSHADRLLVSASKSMHGHALGAGGALELVGVIGALCDGVVAPTLHLENPDPECDLDYVPHVAREAKVRAALSHSFAFGGLNAVLAIKAAP